MSCSPSPFRHFFSFFSPLVLHFLGDFFPLRSQFCITLSPNALQMIPMVFSSNFSRALLQKVSAFPARFSHELGVWRILPAFLQSLRTCSATLAHVFCEGLC